MKKIMNFSDQQHRSLWRKNLPAVPAQSTDVALIDCDGLRKGPRRTA
jgi:hypothetical protein